MGNPRRLDGHEFQGVARGAGRETRLAPATAGSLQSRQAGGSPTTAPATGGHLAGGQSAGAHGPQWGGRTHLCFATAGLAVYQAALQGGWWVGLASWGGDQVFNQVVLAMAAMNLIAVISGVSGGCQSTLTRLRAPPALLHPAAAMNRGPSHTTVSVSSMIALEMAGNRMASRPLMFPGGDLEEEALDGHSADHGHAFPTEGLREHGCPPHRFRWCHFRGTRLDWPSSVKAVARPSSRAFVRRQDLGFARTAHQGRLWGHRGGGAYHGCDFVSSW